MNSPLQAAAGKLIVLSAPSGAGKTTLVRTLTGRLPRLRCAVSYTTRRPRPGERPGEDYYFVDESAFQRRLREGDFLEHARVFDNWYGTSRSQVQGLLAEGFDVLLEIDWQGARQVQRAMPQCLSVFILPPSLEILEQRLRGRGTDGEAVIQRRLRDAVADMSHWEEFGYVIINDQLERAAAALAAIVAGRGGAYACDNPAVRERVQHLLG